MVFGFLATNDRMRREVDTSWLILLHACTLYFMLAMSGGRIYMFTQILKCIILPLVTQHPCKCSSNQRSRVEYRGFCILSDFQ